MNAGMNVKTAVMPAINLNNALLATP